MFFGVAIMYLQVRVRVIIGECSMSHTKPGQAKTTGTSSTVDSALAPESEVVGSSPPAPTYFFSTCCDL
jgi:hypothetical protein